MKNLKKTWKKLGRNLEEDMKDVKRKMDIETAKYIADKAQNDRSMFPVEFEECERCGAQYIRGLGHDCENVIELTWHEYEEGETEIGIAAVKEGEKE